jgi:hypothetical protein
MTEEIKNQIEKLSKMCPDCEPKEVYEYLIWLVKNNRNTGCNHLDYLVKNS